MFDLEICKAIVLGVVQGVTEFLPISSDGHLVLVQTLWQRCTGQSMAHEGHLAYDVVLHIGTLAAIVVLFRRELWSLRKQPRLCLLLVLATIPAGVAGLTLKKLVEQSFESPLAAGLGLLVTAGFLYGAHWYRPPPPVRTLDQVTLWDALVIGLLQALAIAPGISRSGTTICAGVWRGLDRQVAATWSFLMAVPVISGACALVLKDLWLGKTPSLRLDVALVGVTVSFVTGLLALRVLIRMVAAGRWLLFATYCAALGTAVVIWQLIEMSRGA